VRSRPVGPPREGVTEVEVDGSACLFSPAAGGVVLLNQTASDVWYLCDGDLTADEITDRLAAAYRVPAESIAGDVDAAIRSFTESGLLPPP
jgi:hypothetical protein